MSPSGFRQRRPARRPLLCELLEDRCLLSGSTLDQLVVDPTSFAATDILVRFRSDMTPARGPEILRGTAVDRPLPLVAGLHKVWLTPGVSVASALAAYRANPRVLYAEPDYRVHLQAAPNDPQFPSQWDMDNTGQTGGTPDADIDGPQAWDITTGSGQTVVAVIDTGVDYTHPDLAANIWTNAAEANGSPGVDDDGNGYIDDIHGYDFHNHDGNPIDDHNHGTHVAGTIGAVGDNGVGITGINWHVQIMALKILDASGSGSMSAAIEALNYAVANGVKISNNSYGGDPYSVLFEDAIRNARDAGHIFVTAAGNGNIFGIGQNNDNNPFYPSSYTLDNVVAVAATDANDNRGFFSNYGATSVDLGAPGVGILSTTRNNTYTLSDGTSMAAPHVTGVMALVRDLHPTWTYLQVINQVLGTVDPVPALNGTTVTGGRLNAARAVSPPPIIDLSWSGSITGPSTANSWTPVTIDRTYTISGEDAVGDFALTYYASPNPILGDGNDLLLGTEMISAAADKTVGSHAGTSPGFHFTAGGTYYLLAKVDGGGAIFETDESNNVVQAPQLVVVTGPLTFDNGQPGYSETGGGWTDWGGGYGGGFRYRAAGTGSSTAAWQASGLTAGNYEVQVTWVPESNRAPNAPYHVYDGTTLLGTVLVNQRLAPIGMTVNGFVFQSLGIFSINSGTLKVVLSNNASGFVIADAVRMVPLPPPVVDLSWSGGGITGPATAFTQTPVSISRTYTISGEDAASSFDITYYTSGNAVFGDADDVLLGTETISAAADRSVGTHAGSSPTWQFPSVGTYYLLARVDGGGVLPETDENNNVAQAPQQVAVSGPLVLDNGQPGYSEAGAWISYSGGYGGNFRYSLAGNGANTAAWQVTGLTTGIYEVQVTWKPDLNRALDAPFRIYDGTTLVQTVRINQRLAPSGTTVNGSVFQSLGFVGVASGTLRVVLGNDASGIVIADAARFVPLPPPVIDLSWSGGGITGPATASTQTPFTVNRTYTISGEAAAGNFTIAYYASSNAVFGDADDVLLGSETISAAADKSLGPHAGSSPSLQFTSIGTYALFAKIDNSNTTPETDEGNNVAQAPDLVTVSGPVVLDNGQPGYSETGGWSSWTGGYGGGFRYSAAGSGVNTAAWQPSGLTAGVYEVQVTWVPDVNRATDAPYRIYDGTTLLQIIRVNQRLAPSGTIINGSVFQAIAAVSVSGGPLRVVLGNDANGYVIADAVRVAPLPPPVIDLSWSSGGIIGPATASTATPVSISRTYTISGEAASSNFAITYYTSGNAIFGDADDVLLGSETINAAADKSLGTHAGSSPALQFPSIGTYYLFARVDGGGVLPETDESNNVAQAPQQVAVSGPVIVDNGQPGYSEVGTWSGWSGGYGGNFRYSAAGSGSNMATWQVAGLASGNYEVAVRWVAEPNRAPDAPYRIYDGTTLLATIRVNQRQAPVGITVNGFVFRSIATVPIASGTLRVVLGNDAAGYVIADAVRIAPATQGMGGAAFGGSTGNTTLVQTLLESGNPGRPLLAPASMVRPKTPTHSLWNPAAVDQLFAATTKWLSNSWDTLRTHEISTLWAAEDLQPWLGGPLEGTSAVGRSRSSTM